MASAITVGSAAINTFTINVRVLQVGARQVTLSVFRQLPQEDLFDAETLTLRGRPWGCVNYKWGDCSQDQQHLHVVWQKDARLLRCCMEPFGWQEPYAVGRRHRDLSESRGDVALYGALGEALDAKESKVEGGLLITPTWRVRLYGDLTYLLPQLSRPASTYYDPAKVRAEIVKHQDGLLVAATQMLVKDLGALAAWGELGRRMAALEAAYKAAYEGAGALEQLFIAL